MQRHNIPGRVCILARSEEISIIAPSDEEVEIFRQIDFWIKRAYSTGLSRAMLVLAAVCLVSAVIVYIGLHRNNQAMQDRIDDQVPESVKP
jgi:hypothetical protein